MTTRRHIAVIDIGKTNAKLALVDLESLTELAVVTCPNTVQSGPPWPHFDTQAHWEFFLDGLRRFQAEFGVDGISVTTHGASIVLLDGDGGLAAPILDYEHDGPDGLAAAYDALRPCFAQTGSPRLAGGLNVGAQLHWQFAQDHGLRARVAHVMTYPQYWAYRLTGIIASDVTSIGCHTDLWCPAPGGFSDLVAALGITDRMAPVRKPTDILGPVTPETTRLTGLPEGTPVVCGIHDSNASLYPHILAQNGAFSVVSTGTWVIAMTMGAGEVALDPARDTLMNVNALGDPVPSARFMGGREFEMVQGGAVAAITPDDCAAVLADGVMLLPAVHPVSGPFQGRQARWVGREPAQGTGQRAVALAFYLALMTDTCLRLTGASGPAIVEGPFARNDSYLQMLAAATGRAVQASPSATGTSIGAALLFGGTPPKEIGAPAAAHQSPQTKAMARYAQAWRDMVQRVA